MLAYAAETRHAGRAGSPKALTLILAGHAALIAAVMTAKMELVPIDPFVPTDIINVPVGPPPPPPPSSPKAKMKAKQPAPQERFIEQERTIVDMSATIPSTAFDQGQLSDIATVIGSGPTTIPLDPPSTVRTAARFATPDSALKPPYPLDKRRAEEEATLRLRLSIDTRGRVTAVEPVGPAEAGFLEAARRHIIRAWRYKPAMEDGVAVPSSTVINLSFRLEDV